MPCFAAHQKRVEAHVQATGDKKVALVIENVKVSEIKPDHGVHLGDASQK